MRIRSLQRWTEAALLLTSFGALSLYAIFSLQAAAWQGWRSRELNELAEDPQEPRSGPLAEGALVGRLEIPRLNLSTMVLEGVSSETLRMAAGHVPRTSLPGEPGNSAIAAHRDTFFRPLSGIRVGDRIAVVRPGGPCRYRVTSTEIVSPRETRVLEATADETLTLVTCYPFVYVGAAPSRFIVRAVRVEE